MAGLLGECSIPSGSMASVSIHFEEVTMRKFWMCLSVVVALLSVPWALSAQTSEIEPPLEDACHICFERTITWNGIPNTDMHRLQGSVESGTYACTGPGAMHNDCHNGNEAPGLCDWMHHSCEAPLAMDALQQREDSGGDLMELAVQLAAKYPSSVIVSRSGTVNILDCDRSTVIASVRARDNALVIHEKVLVVAGSP